MASMVASYVIPVAIKQGKKAIKEYRKNKKSKKGSSTTISRDLNVSTSSKQDLVEEGIAISVSLAKKGWKKALGKNKNKIDVNSEVGAGEGPGFSGPIPLMGEYINRDGPNTYLYGQGQQSYEVDRGNSNPGLANSQFVFPNGWYGQARNGSQQYDYQQYQNNTGPMRPENRYHGPIHGHDRFLDGSREHPRSSQRQGQGQPSQQGSHPQHSVRGFPDLKNGYNNQDNLATRYYGPSEQLQNPDVRAHEHGRENDRGFDSNHRQGHYVGEQSSGVIDTAKARGNHGDYRSHGASQESDSEDSSDLDSDEDDTKSWSSVDSKRHSGLGSKREMR